MVEKPPAFAFCALLRPGVRVDNFRLSALPNMLGQRHEIPARVKRVTMTEYRPRDRGVRCLSNYSYGSNFHVFLFLDASHYFSHPSLPKPRISNMRNDIKFG